jgi:hypothetical protein
MQWRNYNTDVVELPQCMYTDTDDEQNHIYMLAHNGELGLNHKKS